MAAEKGYDDQFNDGLFRVTRSTSKMARPMQWPLSVSELRGRTDYGAQGMHADHDVAHSNYRVRTQPVQSGQFRRAAPGQNAATGAMRGKWNFDAKKNGWVWRD